MWVWLLISGGGLGILPHGVRFAVGIGGILAAGAKW